MKSHHYTNTTSTVSSTAQKKPKTSQHYHSKTGFQGQDSTKRYHWPVQMSPVCEGISTKIQYWLPIDVLPGGQHSNDQTSSSNRGATKHVSKKTDRCVKFVSIWGLTEIRTREYTESRRHGLQTSFQQKYGIDYLSTISPVVNTTTIKLVLVIAAQQNMCLRQTDVSTSFQ